MKWTFGSTSGLHILGRSETCKEEHIVTFLRLCRDLKHCEVTTKAFQLRYQLHRKRKTEKKPCKHCQFQTDGRNCQDKSCQKKGTEIHVEIGTMNVVREKTVVPVPAQRNK